MVNPYSGHHFLSFFVVLLHRIGGFLTGTLSFEDLVSDEIQILVLGSLAASGALVGTFLILRRMIMLANALSHTILLGIVMAFLCLRFFSESDSSSMPLSVPVLLIAAFLTGIVTTFLTEFLSKINKLQEDASIGLVFSILFSLGIVLVTYFTRNVHVGTELVMGNADALQKGDLKSVMAILGVNAALFLLLFHGYKITTFDPQLARTFGFSSLLFNYLLMIQTSATAIGGFRAVGVLMILAFFVIPPLTARVLTHSLSKLIWLSITIGILGSLIGVALSRHFLTVYYIGLSTGGIVVMTLGGIYFCVVFFLLLSRFIHQRKLLEVKR